jgi:hypothetical protein
MTGIAASPRLAGSEVERHYLARHNPVIVPAAPPDPDGGVAA